tara:strand:- start:1420 stop:1851 length:432 start_codon:yes stop_codon:yes gene_type:complete
LSDDTANPFIMVKRAASGDLEAQRELASGAAACLADHDIIGFWEGLTYARMAAAQGSAADKALVITLLDLGAYLLDPKDAAGQAGYAGQMMAYAMSAVQGLTGPEANQFNDMLDSATDNLSAEEMRAASYWSDLLRQAEKMGE